MAQARGDPGGLLRRWFGGAAAREAPLAVEASVIAVASGKGGTGKSFFATSLAVALSRTMKVVLVDCDYGLGNDHLLLGTTPTATLNDVVAGRVKPGDALVHTAYGPWLLPGGSGVSSMLEMTDAELAALGETLGALAATCDQLILDLGAGISPQVVLTARAAHQLVLVTNADLAALTDAYALVKCLARQPVRPVVGVVVNRVLGAPGDLGPRTFAKLAEVALRFSGYPLHYLGEIPDDPAVAQRRLGQPPILVSHPECSIAAAIDVVRARLQELAGGIGAAPRPTSATLAARFGALIPSRRTRD